MKRPRLLDLFCGAGGCAVGYHRAGFDVVGVDVKFQKNYPFEFHQGDALEFVAEHGREFDAIHASPPCLRFSTMQFLNPGNAEKYPDLVGPTRESLVEARKPWVIENVMTAPLLGGLTLCGSMFKLEVQRHRRFESSAMLMSPGDCRHKAFKGNFQSGGRFASRVVGVYGGDGGGKEKKEVWQRAMGIDWMTRLELAQAIPPAYTEFVGRQLIEHT